MQVHPGNDHLSPVAFLTGQIKVTVKKATSAFLSIANLPVFPFSSVLCNLHPAKKEPWQFLCFGSFVSRFRSFDSFSNSKVNITIFEFDR